MYCYNKTFLCQSFVVTMSMINTWKEKGLDSWWGGCEGLGSSHHDSWGAKRANPTLANSPLFPFIPTFILAGLPSYGMAEPELRECLPPLASPF